MCTLDAAPNSDLRAAATRVKGTVLWEGDTSPRSVCRGGGGIMCSTRLGETSHLFLFFFSSSFLFNHTGSNAGPHACILSLTHTSALPGSFLWVASTGLQDPKHVAVSDYPLEIWIPKEPVAGFAWARDPPLTKQSLDACTNDPMGTTPQG